MASAALTTDVFQNDLFPPSSDWKTPRVADLVSFRGARRVAFDVETRDPQLNKLGMGALRDGQMVGFSYAIEDGPSQYVPLRHAGGDNVEDPWQALGWLREEAAAFEGELVGANLQYDLDYGLSSGIQFSARRYLDIQIAEALLDELKNSYSLETLCADYGLPGKDDELMRQAIATYRLGRTPTEVKRNLWKLPARFVGAYGEGDADRPLRILRRQEKLIEEQGLGRAWDLECRTLPALLAMRRRGVLIDQDHLEVVNQLTYQREREAVERVNACHTGPPLQLSDLNRPEALNRVLLQAGINNPYRTRTGKPSVTKEFLEALPGDIGAAMREAKKWNKLRTTFVDGIKQHMINGRIHCTYNQTRGEDESGNGVEGAATFRLSCKDPNLQQQPARDPEIGPLWRKIYIPEPGLQWASCDYSQQEPRFTTHFAAVMDLPRAREMAQRFCDDPDTDNHQMFADITGVKRSYAKEIFLGHCYGQGGAKTAVKIGLGTAWAARPPGARWGSEPVYSDTDPEAFEEAVRDGGYRWEVGDAECREIIDRVDTELPYVKELAQACKRKVEKEGYLTTYYGHRCRFPATANGKYDFTHKALNRLIQTSSAGQTKMAVVMLHEAGEFLQLQVHDEVDGSVEDRAHGERWATTMRATADLMVPSKVDVEVGPSWGEAK